MKSLSAQKWSVNMLSAVCLMSLVRILPTAAAPVAKATRHLREASALAISEKRSATAFNSSIVHSSSSRISQPGAEQWSDDVSQPMQDLMRQKPEKKKKLMDAINQFRAQVCADMHKEMGKEFGSYEECRDFMKKACKPGKDRQMDGDSKEMTSGKGFCNEFFPAAEKKAKEEVEKEEVKEVKARPVEDTVVDAGPAPAPGAAPSPGVAGAPGPSPGPGPAPGPYVPGISEGPPPIPPAEDEKYYFSKGGKDPVARVHMDEKLKLPAQGYWGKLIEHEDGETATGDWQKEFGPQATQDTYRKICAAHPDNPWCTEQGYHRHSAAAPHGCSAMLLTLALMVFRA